MTTKIFNFNFLATAFITFYAFAINWMSGNLGVMPIDTFGFFDSGTSILHNKLPIRDFWVFTGISSARKKERVTQWKMYTIIVDADAW